MRKLFFVVCICVITLPNLLNGQSQILPTSSIDLTPSQYPLGSYIMGTESESPYSWLYDAGVLFGFKPIHSNYRHIQFITDAVGNRISLRAKDQNNDSWLPWRRVLSENEAGNIGIGTTNPQAKLEINNTTVEEAFKLTTGVDGRSLALRGETIDFKRAGANYIASSNELGSLKFSTGGPLIYGDNIRMTITPTGNVGIGVGNPVSLIDVRTTAGKGIWLNYNEESAVTFYPNNGNSVFHLSHGHDNKLYLSQGSTVGGTKLMTFVNNGNVGIGTIDPGSWKLAVNGKIRAKEIKVETGWPDFVSLKDYHLPTLEEVEDHIKQKGHLENIPSAKEVAKNGILLGEMDAKLLQKIEELTLYTIQQEKKISSLEVETDELKKENRELRHLIQKVRRLEKEIKKIQKNK